MLALVLIDHALRHRAQNADVDCKTPKIPGHLENRDIPVLLKDTHVLLKEDPEPEED